MTTATLTTSYNFEDNMSLAKKMADGTEEVFGSNVVATAVALLCVTQAITEVSKADGVAYSSYKQVPNEKAFHIANRKFIDAFHEAKKRKLLEDRAIRLKVSNLTPTSFSEALDLYKMGVAVECHIADEQGIVTELNQYHIADGAGIAVEFNEMMNGKWYYDVESYKFVTGQKKFDILGIKAIDVICDCAKLFGNIEGEIERWDREALTRTKE